ncbi:flagellin [Halospina sp. K52047b]|uniref:flagellin N-terminal helical domain-containing protein n=1 Tax=Halospina sp. K52047b TaxID=2614160 RepID=UPI001249F13D|nr:flagellin [Halospina sp. K52047b]KAA8977096.1 flagellin [Halospina sp. K52047b]
MPQVINTNIASLNAQRNLNETQGNANTALERLSSGLRINSAKDDAAGLAISERFTAQINGLNQAVRNANDGTSLAQVTEGALGESANALQRIRELAIQSANATNSQSDRDALQAEVSQLKEEIDRIATQTEFNGLRVLDGSYVDQQYQVGANANQTIGISIDSARANEMGSVVNTAGTEDRFGAETLGTATNGTNGSAPTDIQTYSGVNDSALEPSDLSINGEPIASSDRFAGTLPGQEGDSAYAKAAAINGSSIDGVTALAETQKSIQGIGSDNAQLASFTDPDSDDSASYVLEVNETRVLETNLNPGDSISLQKAADSINQSTDTTGVRAEIDTNGELLLTADDGRNIKLNEEMNITDGGGGGTGQSTITSAFQDGFQQDAGSDASVSNTYEYGGQITLQSLENVDLTGDTSKIGFDTNLIQVSEDKNVATIDISDVEGANEAILSVDAALQKINGIRADLGAVQNRFESTIANLSESSVNLESARSRIQDADFAKESAELSRTQTLQQAGLSVLSQANQRPQQVLQLIQG